MYLLEESIYTERNANHRLVISKDIAIVTKVKIRIIGPENEFVYFSDFVPKKILAASYIQGLLFYTVTDTSGYFE